MSKGFLVNEIYPCLQGEGPNLGKPSLLIRFQICNLRCSWCDTPYTHTYSSDPVDPSQSKPAQRFVRMSLEDLVTRIQEYTPLSHLILSGGEPTLHNLAPLMEALGPSYTAEVETNATQIPHIQFKWPYPETYMRFQWNVSPKFSNAGQELVPEALSFWSNLSHTHPCVFFKYVIRKEFAQADREAILKIISDFNQPKHKIYLMPEGTTLESQTQATWLHDICLEHGFFYTPRLHILLFGNKRGV
jgi:7-carboxy-7-deazaguanine synthase